MEGIEKRIERLEKENRFLKRAGAVAGVALACVALMGVAPAPAEPGIVTAREFHLVRADGTEAGYWHVMRTTGLPRLVMQDTMSGHTPMEAAIGFVTADEEPRVMLVGKGKKGEPGGSVELGVQPEGESFLALHDVVGHSDRVRISVAPDGEGKILLRKGEETVSWRAP